MSTAEPSLLDAADSDLPEGWARAALGEIAELVGGAGFPLESQGKRNLKYPFLKVGNLGDVDSSTPLTAAADTVDASVARDLHARIIPPSSIVFAKIGMAIRLNRRRLTGVPCCIDNNMMAAIPNGATIHRYVQRYLETLDFMELAQATTVPSIRKTDLQSLPVRLPPLAEQKRIVERVEQLLALVNAARGRLARVPSVLKRFRQAVLAAACSGRLTTDWRRTHTPGESAASLLDRILKDRKRRYNFVSEKARREGRNRLKPPKNLVQQDPDAGGLEELPETWLWVSWNDLVDWITYGFTRPMPHVVKGIPIVTAKNVLNSRIDFATADYTTPAAFEELSEKDRPRMGEILLTKDGSIGRAAVVETEARFCINQSVALLRFGGLTAHVPYLRCGIQAPFTQKLIEEGAEGTAIRHISITTFATFPVPLPPPEEQREIVCRVEALFKLADAIEKRVAAATAHAEKLTQAILARAFRGELVPTEAELARREGRSYEPASALLARIRAERSVTAEQDQTRQRNSKRQSRRSADV